MHRAIFTPLAACVCLLGCANTTDAPRSKPAAAAPAVADPDLDDSLGQSIAQLVKEDTPDWIKVERLWRGELQPRERRGFLAVLVYGHCYRIFGVGGPGVSDLDLVLLDPNGVETHRDVTQSETAIVGVESPICPNDPGAYRIEARMRSGSGPFAIGLYRDPR